MRPQYKAGLFGESQAEEYLCNLGLQPLTRRYRGADGEIDLIMLDGECIVFVEVKSRPGSPAGSGLMAVTPTKQRRITHAALTFLSEREWMERPVRFDVVEISGSGILHIPNAFMAAE